MTDLRADHTTEAIRTRIAAATQHSYIGDLKLTLVCPDGSSTLLHNRAGGSSNDILASFSVSECAGQTMAGNWILKVSDHAYADIGTLQSWTLHLR